MKNTINKTISLFISLLLIFNILGCSNNIGNLSFSLKDITPPPLPSDPSKIEKTMLSGKESNFEIMRSCYPPLPLFSSISTPLKVKVSTYDATLTEFEIEYNKSTPTTINFNWKANNNDGKPLEPDDYPIFIEVLNKNNNQFTVCDGGSIRVLPDESDPSSFIPADELATFESQDFKILSSKIKNIPISQYQANNFRDIVKEISTIDSKIESLNLRTPVDSDKINNLLSLKVNLEQKKNALAGDLMVSFSQANSLKNEIRSHINNITKNSSYSLDYTPDEKPESVGDYSERGYFLDLDIRNTVYDGVNLYAPDEEDPDQDNLKEVWEVNKDRIELISPDDAFEAVDLFGNEILVAKDLINDYLNNKFVGEDLEVSETLNGLVNQLIEHKQLVYAKVNNLEIKYNQNFEQLKESVETAHNGFLLPLAEAMRQEGSFNDNTFVTQALSFDTKKIWTLSDLKNWVKTYVGVLKSFKDNPNLTVKEKVVAITLGYTPEDFNTLKQLDVKYGTTVVKDLVDSYMELVEATGVPTNATSALLTFSGPLGKLAGKLGKAGLNKLAKKTPGRVKEIFQDLKREVTVFRSEAKQTAKNVPCFNKLTGYKKGIGISSFSTYNFKTLAKIPCPSPEDFDKVFHYIKGLGNNTHLKGLYPKVSSKNVLAKSSNYTNTLSNYIKKNKTLANDENFILLKAKIDTKFTYFKKNGVKIKKAEKYEVYAADLEEHGIAIVDLGKKVKGNHSTDFSDAYLKLKDHPTFKELIPSYVNNATEFKDFIHEIGLTWHHHEGLNKMILIDQRIHKGVSHWGSVSIVTRFLTESNLANNPFFETAYLTIMNSLK